MKKFIKWRQIRGNLSLLANKLEVTPAAVYKWDRIPAEHCLTIEKMSGISRYDLRPDVYGKKPKGVAA